MLRIVFFFLLLFPSFSYAYEIPDSYFYSSRFSATSNVNFYSSVDTDSYDLRLEQTNAQTATTYGGFVFTDSTSSPLYSTIDEISIDYDLTVTSGASCNLSFLYYTNGTAEWSLLTGDVQTTSGSKTFTYPITNPAFDSFTGFGFALRTQNLVSDCSAQVTSFTVDGVEILPFQSSSSEIIYIPISTYATSLECVQNSPTSTCNFTYSTSTATDTQSLALENIDGTLKSFLLWLLFFSFMIGTYALTLMFKSKKYGHY